MSRNSKQKQQSVMQKNKNKKQNKSVVRARSMEEFGSFLRPQTIAKMLKDPCAAQQLPGSYGSRVGDVLQVKTRWSPPGDSTGWPHLGIVWFPDYNDAAGADGTAVNSNIVYFPTVTTTDPNFPTKTSFGTAPRNGLGYYTSYGSIKDPASDLINSGAYSMIRTVSACIRIVYRGKTGDESGELYAIPKISPYSIVNGGTGDQPPGISQLVNMSPYAGERTSEMEVRYRPVVESMELGSKNQHMFTCVPNASPTYAGSSTDASGIGLVLTWANDITGYVIEFIKNVEVIPDSSLGVVAPPPRGIDDMRALNQAILHLERTDPKWQYSTGGRSGGLESALRSVVLGGRQSRR